MTRITVDHGGSRDAAFPVSVNGEIIVIQAGVEQDIPAAYVEAIQHTYGILGHVHGSGGDSNAPPALIESNFRDGVYKIIGSAVTLGDIWIEDTDWASWQDYTITPGLGYIKTYADGDAPTFQYPTLKQGLMGSVLSFADGFTVLIEGSFTYEFLTTGEVGEDSIGLDFSVGFQLLDLSNFQGYRQTLVGASYVKAQGVVDRDYYQIGYTADTGGGNIVATATDQQIPLGPSPQIFRAATSISAAAFASSLNGRTPITTDAGAGIELPVDFVMLFDVAGNKLSLTVVLEYVAFYPEFASDADLQTLTAP